MAAPSQHNRHNRVAQRKRRFGGRTTGALIFLSVLAAADPVHAQEDSIKVAWSFDTGG